MAGRRDDGYRLQAVRLSREREERTKRQDFAAVVGDARDAQARLDAARARTDAARAAVAVARTSRAAVLAAGASSTSVLRAEQFVARRLRDVDDAGAEELRCEVAFGAIQGHVDAARLTLSRARAEREVI